MLTRRCRGLTAVGLEAEGNINPPPDLPTGVGGWERSDLTKLAVGCPDIQDLRFPVDIKRWRFDKDSQEPTLNPGSISFNKLENLYITFALRYPYITSIYLPVQTETLINDEDQLPAQLSSIIDELRGRKGIEQCQLPHGGTSPRRGIGTRV
ncbi:hypothetical protein P167DRAFT_537279 [Morchella conica CCBAS932]|uniref:Uncharacterized protein n=1 Tax=Morchella conica CCBAS932 TaxID=1392247 RepID=A0A3N4KQV6_9PEZI|nr:hypothetical protein P167DRAFT_537279 [Morchella conica CCBAS932]